MHDNNATDVKVRPLVSQSAPWSMPPPWWRTWHRGYLTDDLVAGLVVAVMLIPQSLAYAMLAGLPPHVGLMASLLPLVAYAVFGSSAYMSVGPAAITSLMMAQAMAPLAAPGTGVYLAMAAGLALGSGLLLMVMGCLRLGFLSQLLGRPVVQGFTVASALLIMAGQVSPLMGWDALGHTLPQWCMGLMHQLQDEAGRWRWQAQWGSLWTGGVTLCLLWLGPRMISALDRRFKTSAQAWVLLTRLWPLCVLMLMSVWAQWANQHSQLHVAQVGTVSVDVSGAVRALTDLSHLSWPQLNGLVMPVLLITLVSFVSSMSVAQTFALKHGERIDSDRELLGLGLANLGSAVVGGMAVAGGLSRSAVNESAGARSPMAGIFAAAMVGLLMWLLLPWLGWLPKAALAAVIIMAVSSLVRWDGLVSAWRYDRIEAYAFISTGAGVLFLGFESGILLGMAWSLSALIWRHSQPNLVEVGRLPGTEHFRNVRRYQTEVLPNALMIRVDETLDFTNIQYIETRLNELVSTQAHAQHVVLILSSVNRIDYSAMQALLEFDEALQEQGRRLYLAEVKGPIMDRLAKVGMDQRFSGRIFLSAQDAWKALQPHLPSASER